MKQSLPSSHPLNFFRESSSNFVQFFFFTIDTWHTTNSPHTLFLQWIWLNTVLIMLLKNVIYIPIEYWPIDCVTFWRFLCLIHFRDRLKLSFALIPCQLITLSPASKIGTYIWSNIGLTFSSTVQNLAIVEGKRPFHIHKNGLPVGCSTSNACLIIFSDTTSFHHWL